MKMIEHEAERMHPPTRLGARLPQRPNEPLPVLIVPEYRLPPVPAIHDMIDRSGIFHSELPRHAQQPAPHPVRMAGMLSG